MIRTTRNYHTYQNYDNREILAGGATGDAYVQTPVRGENLAGFLQLAEHDEGEHHVVAVMDV